MLNEAQVIKTAKSAIMQGADGGVATLAWAQRAEAVKSSVKYTMVVALGIRIERADLHSSNHALRDYRGDPTRSARDESVAPAPRENSAWPSDPARACLGATAKGGLGNQAGPWKVGH